MKTRHRIFRRGRPHASPRHWPLRVRGFTLVELLIVVTIVAIIASVVIPAARPSGTLTLESAARQLAADLRLARGLAIQYDTDWAVQFDVNANSYEVVHTGSGSPPAPVNPLLPPSQQGGPYVIDFDDIGNPFFGGMGVQLAGAALADSGTNVNDITFGPLGGTGPSRGEDTVIQLTVGTAPDMRFIRITISWITGQVQIGEPSMALTP